MRTKNEKQNIPTNGCHILFDIVLQFNFLLTVIIRFCVEEILQKFTLRQNIYF